MQTQWKLEALLPAYLKYIEDCTIDSRIVMRLEFLCNLRKLKINFGML